VFKEGEANKPMQQKQANSNNLQQGNLNFYSPIRRNDGGFLYLILLNIDRNIQDFYLRFVNNLHK
jgi:hypothetical protein